MVDPEPTLGSRIGHQGHTLVQVRVPLKPTSMFYVETCESGRLRSYLLHPYSCHLKMPPNTYKIW